MRFALAALAVSGSGAARAQVSPTPDAPVNLGSGQTMTLAVRPREYRTVQVTAPIGKYTEFRMELPAAGVSGSFVKVQPAPTTGANAADPAISDSGQNFVRVPIPDGSATPVTLQVTVLTNSRADTAAVDAHLSVVTFVASPQQIENGKALAFFSHAELLRRTHVGGEKALTVYQDALAAAKQSGDPILEQQILLSAGRMLMTDGRHYADAVSWERQAVSVAGTDGAPSVQALAWKMLGGALLNTAQYAESLDASARALALYERTGETFWQGVVLENMGEAQLNLGDLPKALATEERALALSRALHDDFGVVEMLAEIGSIHRTRGEYQAALDDFSEAVEITLPSSYNPMQGEAWLAMGELHREVAEPQRAADDFGRALTIAQHTSSGLNELESRAQIAGLLLERGDLQGAQEGFTQALARSRELKLVRPQSGLLIGLARTAVKLGHAAQAEQLLQQAIDTAQGIHQQAAMAEAYETLGQIAESTRQAAAARSAFAKAAALYEEISDKAGLAQADASLARAEARAGEVEAALGHLNQAMNIVESSRTSFSRGALRTRYFAAQRATHDQAIALLMDQDAKHPGTGFAEQAWRVAERARARSLLDELWASGTKTDADPASSALRQRLAALEVKIGSLEAQQAQAGSNAEDVATVVKIQTDLRSAVLAADELESRIRSAAPSTATMPVEKLAAAQFASTALGPQDALVEYWLASDASYAWLITKDGTCAGYRLPAANVLRDQIVEYRKALLARNEILPGESLRGRDLRVAAADNRTNQLAGTLGALLLPPALEQRLTRVHRLLLVADGPLAQVPFAGLRLSSKVGRGRYLIERFEPVSEPSAAFLTIDRRPASAAGDAPVKVAVFADPVYNRADARLTNRRGMAIPVAIAGGGAERASENVGLANLPRLPGSRREALQIAAIAGPEHSAVFAGFDATPAAVRNVDWRHYSLVHFAVHAIAQNGGRDSAGLLLSMLDAEGKRQDGVLWLRDIYGTHVARDLVVLSGCETALGESTPGEGMNSLARGFLFSGTLQVAATLWSADDVSSSTLMGRFYENLILRRMNAAQGLRESQLTLMRQPRYAAPIYWAGFMLEGD